MKLLSELPHGRLDPIAEQGLAYKLRSASARTRNAAARQLVINSMREACLYAHRCCRGALPADEIFSLCYSALRRAAPNFRPGSIRFFAYAKVYVRSEICREWRAKGVIRNVPNENFIPWGQGAIAHRSADYSPLKLVPDGSREEPSDEKSVGFDFESVGAAEQSAALGPVLLRVLNRREQQVVQLYYRSHLNFREIGAKLSVSRSWAQILHARAIRKLRASSDELKGLL